MERGVASGGNDASGPVAEIAGERFHSDIVAHQETVEADPLRMMSPMTIGDRLAGRSGSHTV